MYRRAWGAQHCFKMLFYVYFGNINSAVRAKIPVGDVSWGLLASAGQNWPFPPRAYTKAYEHRLGPNSVCELSNSVCKKQPYSPPVVVINDGNPQNDDPSDAPNGMLMMLNHHNERSSSI